MGVVYSKADTAPPPMPNFVGGASPVVTAAIADLKADVRRRHHLGQCIIS